MWIKATKGAFRFCESKTIEEKCLDTKCGKQLALKDGSAELSTALMSIKLDEKNIELVSNQTIDISAAEELNIGKSIFISKDKDGKDIVTIEETKNISIETEELNTLSVTTTKSRCNIISR